MNDQSLLNQIKRIVHSETIFLRHYIGEVIDNLDEDFEGKVQVAVLELGIEDQKNGFWCVPRDKSSMIVPKKGSHVEVYFIHGDPDRPVYMGSANEMDGVLPKNYKTPKTQVIYENQDDDKANIIYDETTGIMKVNADKINIGGTLKNY